MWYPPIRRTATLVAIIAIAALVLGARPVRAQTEVEGRVVEASTGNPVSAAAVQVGTVARAVADADGVFRLRLPAGTHEAMVRRIGYEPAVERWTVGAEPLRVTVTLRAAALALTDLRVVSGRYVERLESRLRALPVSTRSFDREVIERSVSPTASDFIRVHGHLFRAPCPGSRSLDCVRHRMRTVPLAVWIDERRAIGGLRELESMPLDEIGRVEVVDGYNVRVYTVRFLEDAGKRGLIPMSTLQ